MTCDPPSGFSYYLAKMIYTLEQADLVMEFNLYVNESFFEELHP